MDKSSWKLNMRLAASQSRNIIFKLLNYESFQIKVLHSSSNGSEIKSIYIQLPSCQPVLCRLGSASSQQLQWTQWFSKLQQSLLRNLPAAEEVPVVSPPHCNCHLAELQSLPHCGMSRALPSSRDNSWGLPAHKNPTASLWPAWSVCSLMDRSMHSPQERRQARNTNWVQSRETLLMAAADLGPYLHQEHMHMSTFPPCSQGNKMALGYLSNPCPPHCFSGGLFFFVGFISCSASKKFHWLK